MDKIWISLGYLPILLLVLLNVASLIFMCQRLWQELFVKLFGKLANWCQEYKLKKHKVDLRKIFLAVWSVISVIAHLAVHYFAFCTFLTAEIFRQIKKRDIKRWGIASLVLLVMSIVGGLITRGWVWVIDRLTGVPAIYSEGENILRTAALHGGFWLLYLAGELVIWLIRGDKKPKYKSLWQQMKFEDIFDV